MRQYQYDDGFTPSVLQTVLTEYFSDSLQMLSYMLIPCHPTRLSFFLIFRFLFSALLSVFPTVLHSFLPAACRSRNNHCPCCTQQVLILFSAPHGQGNVLGKGCRSGLLHNVAGFGGGLRARYRLCGSRVCTSSSTAASGGSAAGSQGQGHCAGHCQRNLLLHKYFSFFIFPANPRSGFECATHLRIHSLSKGYKIFILLSMCTIDMYP